MAEEKKPIIAFLGPEASYTHQVSLNLIRKSRMASSIALWHSERADFGKSHVSGPFFRIIYQTRRFFTCIYHFIFQSSLLFFFFFSHPQATLNVFPTASHTLAPQITIEDVFAAVQNGHAYRGVVPFENSSNGSVVFTLDLFANLNGKYPDILVCGESYVTVRHCLLGFTETTTSSSTDGRDVKEEEKDEKDYNVGIDGNLGVLGGTASPAAAATTATNPSTNPLSNLSQIKKLYSHPQAWGQCKVFLNTHLKHTERHDVSSTSRAAQLVAQDKSGESAAISSITAASVFGLEVLAKGIEDREGNCTRFLVIRKSPSSSPSSPSSPSASSSSPPPPTTNPYKTLLSFTISHSSPGALAHSLSALANHGLNLTSINTRPSGLENWNYIFFVELEGRKEEEGQGEGEEGPVNRALKDLEKVCSGYRWLGSWESAL